MIYWRRYNGDYIIFQEKNGEFTAEYLNIEFALHRSDNEQAWVMRYWQRLSESTSHGGSCGQWDHMPTQPEIGAAVERFIDTLNLHQK